MTQPTPYLLLQPGFPRGTSRPESDAALADFRPAFSCTQDAAFDLLTRSETAIGCTEDHGRFCFAAGPDQGDQRAGKNPAAHARTPPSPEQRLSSRVHATISSLLFCTRFTQTRSQTLRPVGLRDSHALSRQPTHPAPDRPALVKLTCPRIKRHLPSHQTLSNLRCVLHSVSLPSSRPPPLQPRREHARPRAPPRVLPDTLSRPTNLDEP